MFKDIIREVRKEQAKEIKPEFKSGLTEKNAHLYKTYTNRKPASTGGSLDMKISILETAIHNTPQAVHDLLQMFGLRITNSTSPPFFNLVLQGE